MDKHTRAQEWQRLAEMDLSSAEYLLNMHPVPVNYLLSLPSIRREIP